MANQDTYVTIHTFHDLMQAEIARAKFESEGLEVQLQHGSLATVYPTPGGGVGGSRLQVPADQVEHAKRVLNEFLARTAETTPEDEDIDAPATDEGDGWMRRAAAGAVLGTFMCPPLTLYALWILATRLHESRSGKGNTMMVIAVVFSIITGLLWGVVLWSTVQTAPGPALR